MSISFGLAYTAAEEEEELIRHIRVRAQRDVLSPRDFTGIDAFLSSSDPVFRKSYLHDRLISVDTAEFLGGRRDALERSA